MKTPEYTTRTILASGIPLGGIGTGSVEIMPDGRFRDWELFNNYQWSGNREETPPEMWNEDAFFALRTKTESGPPRVRLLYLDDDPPATLSPKHDNAFLYNFPFLRNISGIRYSGDFPFARLRYLDDALPVEAEMTAHGSFIPHNSKDSGLPLAFFRFTLRNRGDSPCESSLLFSMRNFAGYDGDSMALRHRVTRAPDARMVHMDATDLDPGRRTAGSTCIAVFGDDDSLGHATAWTSGRGATEGRAQEWDEGAGESEFRETWGFSHVFFPFRDTGGFPGGPGEWMRPVRREVREVEPGTLQSPLQREQWIWRGSVGRKITLAPGEEQEVVFVFGWHFPNHHDFKFRDHRHGHMYENWFADAAEVVRYGIAHQRRLHDESAAFARALGEGSLPANLTHSLSAQLTSLVKSTFWTKSGDMALWEGQSCCQLLPGARTFWSCWPWLLLFPDIYTPMVRPFVRSGGFAVSECCGDEPPSAIVALRQRRSRERETNRGTIYDRVMGPGGRYDRLGYTRDDIAPPAIGGGIGAKQILLESQWSGDRALMEELWPAIRDGIDEAIRADTDGDGLPSGLSRLTYDHWLIPATNCYRCSLWLSDLRAAIAMAERMDEPESARRFAEVLERGQASFERIFWNGDYYSLCYDPKIDRTDDGCMADQVSGQFFARILGLDPVHDVAHARDALRAVHRHNLLEEEGLLNGSDPRGRTDWRYFSCGSAVAENEARGGQWPTPWTGTEYFVAAVMAAEGLWKEAMDIVDNVWQRHLQAGMVFNHIECGEHYFRALAVWAILPAVQGLVYDRTTASLRLSPRAPDNPFDSILVLPGAWGRFIHTDQDGRRESTIRIDRGELPLRTLRLDARTDDADRVQVLLNREPVDPGIRIEESILAAVMAADFTLHAGDVLSVVQSCTEAVRTKPSSGLTL